MQNSLRPQVVRGDTEHRSGQCAGIASSASAPCWDRVRRVAKLQRYVKKPSEGRAGRYTSWIRGSDSSARSCYQTPFGAGDIDIGSIFQPPRNVAAARCAQRRPGAKAETHRAGSANLRRVGARRPRPAPATAPPRAHLPRILPLLGSPSPAH